MAKKYKTTITKCGLGDALDASGTEDLKDQMVEWRENLESNSMENLPVYETVSETANTLEEGCDELQQMCEELSTLIEDAPEAWELPTEISYQFLDTYGRKSTPRWMQMSNALSPLQSAVEAIKEALDDDDKPDEDGKRTEALEKAGEIEEKWQEVEGVEFPGMYG